MRRLLATCLLAVAIAPVAYARIPRSSAAVADSEAAQRVVELLKGEK